MKVTHNIQSLNAIRLVNVNIESFAESTGKISSGYKINSAADYPAGLGISEIMRRQIRGLMQATNNTKDGVAFVQTADGAMNEIHSMLQRMNELTDKALNGTWSDSDRMAMNVEFDQLRSEIDRINKNTDFGTGIPVFEEHEPSYYQISGSKKWDDNQLHTISSMANELNIHLPDGYEPKDYTITVPAGVYTTQELIDEIDDALSNMTPPNPGFVFELTSDGYCNLNFEKADGTPTKIDFVDGSLSYLLYDFQQGGGSASILGTTVFDIHSPYLTIHEGKNDTLGFYTEDVTGTNYYTITIPPKTYSRAQMIDKINELLAEISAPEGIVAKEYGDTSIQITGGDEINIIGLKGNMFKYEDSRIEVFYTSVFYDNVNYGSGSNTTASITGNYHNSSIPIYINDSNNTLRFKLNGADEYTTITLTNKKDGYSINELVNEINTQLKAIGLDQDVVASAWASNHLRLSSTLGGAKSKLEFDTSEPLYAETYRTLFLSTSNTLNKYSGQLAFYKGARDLSGTITLDKGASLTLNINNTQYILDGFENSTNLSQLVSNLNEKLNEKIRGTDIENKIKFTGDNNNLCIEASSTDISSIYISDRNKTYEYLFTYKGIATVINNCYYSQTSGSISGSQGSTQTDITSSSASVTIPQAMSSDPIIINGNNNQLKLSFRNTYLNNTGRTSHTETITIPTDKDYNTISDLVTEINDILSKSTNEDLRNTTVSYNSSSGKMTFTSTPSAAQPSGTWDMNILDYDSSNFWKSILGTTETDVNNGPSSQNGYKATLSTQIPLPSNITLDSSNNILKLNLGKGQVTIELDPNKPYTRALLQTALQTEFDKSGIKPGVKVNIDGSGYIELSTVDGNLNAFENYSASGSFYENLMIRSFVQNPYSHYDGTYTFKDAFVTGSKDLTVEPIEIISGTNDTFTFDLTYNKNSNSSSDSFVKTISVTIPEGIYNGNSLAAVIQKAINSKFSNDKEGLADFKVTVGIGTHYIDVKELGADKALQITVTNADGKEPPVGQYIVDGVRGNSACYIFYKTNGSPKATYIVGTKNIWEGVSFEPGKNVLTLSADSVPYQYTFEKPYYTAEEFLKTLNDKFEKGDDNGNPVPLKAYINNGVLKISYTIAGSHTITDIGGSGRSSIFFEEEGRDSRDPLKIQVGSEADQTTEIPRISVSSTALGINSITISKQKYADKANVRIKEAINQLSSKRSTYGAIQNRLEHTINSNDIVIERMQASESLLRDTDLSSEMIRYSSLSILLQAGQKMLAQSNENIKKLLNLLQ